MHRRDAGMNELAFGSFSSLQLVLSLQYKYSYPRTHPRTPHVLSLQHTSRDSNIFTKRYVRIRIQALVAPNMFACDDVSHVFRNF
jgi:hypothetical protein